jgi:divalent metal cation (Fe/Co/Zn/Cd) transporter
VLAGWLFAFVSVLAVVLVMAHFRDTAAMLWEPFRRFLARLHVAVAGLGVWIALFVLAAPVWLENISLDLWRWGREQLRRLAYMGFWPPILT